MYTEIHGNVISLIMTEEDYSEQFFLLHYKDLLKKYGTDGAVIITSQTNILHIFPIPNTMKELKKMVSQYKTQSNYIGFVPFINNPNVIDYIHIYEKRRNNKNGESKLSTNQTR